MCSEIFKDKEQYKLPWQWNHKKFPGRLYSSVHKDKDISLVSSKMDANKLLLWKNKTKWLRITI